MTEEIKKSKKEFWLAMLSYFGIPSVIAIISFFVLRNNLKFPEEVIITMLFFIIPLIIVHIIKLEMKENSGSIIKRQHFIDKSLKVGDSVMSALLAHFSEDCYNRCSNYSDKCAGCPNFSKECNGLLRNYLLEECYGFQSSINMVKQGQYQLSTKIERFHTIAIDHLIGIGDKEYTVIHWFGNGAEETYDDLDFHFLSALLTKLTDKDSNTNEKSYFERVKFRIRWLLIGNIDSIKNKCDYIFHVVAELGFNDISETLFKFYNMEENKYQNLMTAEIAQLSPLLQKYFKNKPNVGIFGTHFMFAESENADEHGIIYTKYHNTTANQTGSDSVSEALIFINKAIQKSGNAIPYSTLKLKYDELPEEHRKDILAARWKSRLRNN
jgi:hypothetical protein